MTDFDTVPLPKPRDYNRRVTDKMKRIKPGQSMLFTDEAKARAFYQWIRMRGTAVYLKEGSRIRVGRTG